MQVSERVMAPSVGDPDAELVQPHCRKCDHQLAAFVALPWSIGCPSCHAPNVAGQIPSETQDFDCWHCGVDQTLLRWHRELELVRKKRTYGKTGRPGRPPIEPEITALSRAPLQQANALFSLGNSTTRIVGPGRDRWRHPHDRRR